MWNYEKYVVEKTTFKHLLPVKPQHSVFFRVTEYLVIMDVTYSVSVTFRNHTAKVPFVGTDGAIGNETFESPSEYR